MAVGRSAHPARQTGRRVLSVPGHLGVPVARRHPHVGGTGNGAAQRRPCGGHARRGLRRARLLPSVVRDLDARARARHESDTGISRRRRSQGSSRDKLITSTLLSDLEAVVGRDYVRTADDARETYGADALKRGHPADAVVLPDGAEEVAAVVRLCAAARLPIVPRGAGTGYTGGAVPVRGGIVISLERMNRILEIDEDNLVAVVEPNVVTATLQAAVERVGLFYPPDPASLKQSVIGGNVAECAGGPRAFKYGTT